MLFISFSRSWGLGRLTTAALFLASSVSTKANFWSLRDPDFQPGRMNWSDLTYFPQRDLSFSTSQALGNGGGSSWTTIRLNNQDLTLTESGDTVLNLRSLVIDGGTLTLEATAGTAITINVRNQFSLTDAARIVLAGGLQCSDVTFNILGRGRSVKIREQSMLSGTINALHRTVRVSEQSLVVGWVHAKRIRLLSGGMIIPPVVSP